MSGKFVGPFVVLIVAAATLPAGAQIIPDIGRRQPDTAPWRALAPPSPMVDGSEAHVARTDVPPNIPTAPVTPRKATHPGPAEGKRAGFCPCCRERRGTTTWPCCF